MWLMLSVAEYPIPTALIGPIQLLLLGKLLVGLGGDIGGQGPLELFLREDWVVVAVELGLTLDVVLKLVLLLWSCHWIKIRRRWVQEIGLRRIVPGVQGGILVGFLVPKGAVGLLIDDISLFKALNQVLPLLLVLCGNYSPALMLVERGLLLKQRLFGEGSDAIGESVAFKQVQLSFTVLARLLKHLLDLLLVFATSIDVSVLLLLIRIRLLLLSRIIAV